MVCLCFPLPRIPHVVLSCAATALSHCYVPYCVASTHHVVPQRPGIASLPTRRPCRADTIHHAIPCCVITTAPPPHPPCAIAAHHVFPLPARCRVISYAVPCHTSATCRIVSRHSTPSRLNITVPHHPRSTCCSLPRRCHTQQAS